jgi:hypothetical protein
MIQRAFDELGYCRYEWKCNAVRAPSRAATRLGFQFEGIFRRADVVKGRNRDAAWFAIIDREWPALGAALERQFDPGNFDETGRQRVSLTSLTAGLGAGGLSQRRNGAPITPRRMTRIRRAIPARARQPY